NDRSKNRYIVRNGRLVNLPMSPLAFLKTPLFSTSSKFRLLREPFIRPADPNIEETLADFVRRRLGEEFLDYAINPFVAGVYAGDPEELSLASSFPKLHELEREYGSLIKGAIKGARARKKRGSVSKQTARLFSFKNGMQQLVDALTALHSESTYTDVRIDAIQKEESDYVIRTRFGGESASFRSRGIVLAVPTHAYDELRFEFDVPIREEISKIVYPPVAVVFFGYRDNPASIPLDGFGFLVPKKERREIPGTIWNSTIFPGRAPTGGTALTTFVGGTRQPENVALPDDRLVETVGKDLRALMGIDRTPDTIVIRRWEKAIPQYRMDHRKIVDAIEAFERRCPGLYVTGNFRGGISVSDCITQADAVAKRVASELSGQRVASAHGEE
ncbi:MAG: protoporphyrinogen oxidase, partial [Candidatus Latescibacterota bacterium]